MAERRLDFTINVKSKTSGIKQLSAELQKIAQIKIQGITDEKEVERLKEARTAAKTLNEILNKSFNIKLNTLDVTKFNQELQKSGTSLHDLQLQLNRTADGKKSIRGLVTELATTNTELKKTESFLDNIGTTLVNAAKWSVAYGVINKIADAIRQSYDFAKDLDESLNDIRIVTGKSAEDMEKFAKQANTAAAALGKTTKDYTTASLIFYQQGLSDKDVKARTDVTMKAANVTGQNAQEVSQQLTAIWNGYKVSAEEAETYIDKVSAVAATTASNLQELSEGMSKVASSANAMGVDIDQLNAQLSTIITVTRQDAGTAGTALKTIFARITSIQSGLDTETTLGQYTAKMAKFGINVLDAQGELRDVGNIIEEIGGKWESFSKTQQVALAQAMAGTRQYNNLMALFNNWDMYEKSLEVSKQAEGTLQNQQDVYMDSLQAHLNQLQAAKEKIYTSLFDSESFKKLVDGLSFILDKVGAFIDNIGGAVPTFSLLASVLLKVFNKQVSNGIADMVINMQNMKLNSQASIDKIKELSEFKFSNEHGLNEMTKAIRDAGVETEKLYKAGLITPEEKESMNERIKELADLANEYDNLQRKREAVGKSLTDSGVTVKDKAIDKETFAEIEKFFDNNIEFQQQVEMAIEESKGELSSFLEEMDKLVGDQTKNKDNIFVELYRSLKELKTETENFANSDSLKSLQDATTTEVRGKKRKDQLNAAMQSVGAGVKKLKNPEMDAAWEKTKKSIEEVEKSKKLKVSEKLKQEQELLAQFEKTVADQSTKAGRGLEELGKAGKQAGKKIRAGAKDAQDGLKKNDAAIRNITKTATQYVSIAMSLITVWESAKSTFEKFNSAEATTGEKISALISFVMASLPILTPIVTALFTAVKGGIKTTSATAQTEAPKMGAAMWASLGPYAIIGLIIAGVYLFIEAIKAVADSYRKEEKAVDKANESLKKQTELYNQAKEAYDKLKSSIENYKTAQKAIEEMTKGTQEWKNAIADANEQVMDLVAAYPELAASVQKSVDTATGTVQLSLDENGLEGALAAAQKTKDKAYVQKLQAQNNLRAAQNTLNAKNLNKELDIGQGAGGYWKAAGKGMASAIPVYGQLASIGSTIESFKQGNILDGLTRVADTVTGGFLNFKDNAKGIQEIADGDVAKGIARYVLANIPFVGRIANSFFDGAEGQIEEQQNATKTTEDALTELAKAYIDQGDSAFYDLSETLKDFDQGLISALEENTGALKENVIALANNLEATKLANQQLMSTYLKESGGANYQNADAETQQALDAVAGALYDEEYKRQQKIWEDKGHLGGGKTDEEIQQLYAELMGYDKSENLSGNKGKYRRKNAETGEYEWIEIDDDIARNAIAQAEAQKIIAKNLNAQSINNISKLALGGAANKEEQDLFKSSMLKLAGGEKSVNLQDMTEEQVKKWSQSLYSSLETLSEEDAKNFGFEGVTKLREAIENSVNKFTTAWQDSMDRLSSKQAKQLFAEGGELSNFNLAQRTIMSDLFYKLQKSGTEKDVNALSNLFTKTNLTDEQNSQLINLINSTDWSSEGALDSFQKNLKANNISIDTNLLDDFYDGIIKTTAAYGKFDLAKSQDFVASINKIAESVTKIGDSISAEDYDKLSSSMQDYFTQMADGTYVLTKSAGAFYAKVMEEERKRVATAGKNAIKAYEENKNRNATEEYFEGHGAAKAIVEGKFDKNVLNKVLDFESDKVKSFTYKDKSGSTHTGYNLQKYFGGEEQLKNILKAAEDSGINVSQLKDENGNWISDLSDNDSVTSGNFQIITGILEKLKEENTYAINQELGIKAVQDQIDSMSEENKQAISDAFKQEMALAFDEEDLQNIIDKYSVYSSIIDNFDETANKAKEDFKALQEVTKIEVIDTQEKYNAALERTQALLDNIQSKDTKYGSAKINNLKQQSKLYNDMIATQKAALTDLSSEAYAENLKENLTNSFVNISGYIAETQKTHANAFSGISVKDPTYFANIEEFYSYIEQLEEEVNKEGIGATYKEQLGTFIEDLKENGAKYYTLENEILQKEADYYKARQDYLNNEITIIKEELTLVKDLAETTKALNDFNRKMFASDYGTIAQSYASDYGANQDTYNGLLAQRQQLLGLLAENPEDATLIKELQANQKELYTSVQSMQENIKNIEETRLTLGQKINEQYERQIKNAENQVSILNHQIKLTKILAGEKAYGQLSGYYTGIREQKQAEYDLSLNKYNEAWTTYNALGENASDEIRQKALDDIVETGKVALTNIENILDAAKQEFEYNIKATLNTVSDIAAAEMGINNYNWQYDFDTNHMSGMTKDLQLANLGIKYQKAINAQAADESAQKRLLAVYQEVNKVLEKKETITKNDIALAEKRLALEQARIDLENAQNDTSKMKLVRGANGEYNYQYMADENNILDKMTAYNNAELAYQEQVRSSLKETTAEATKLIDLFNQLSTAETAEEQEEIWNRITQQIGALKDSAEGLDLSALPSSVQDFITQWTSKGSDSLNSLKDETKEIAQNYQDIKDNADKASKSIIGGGEEGNNSLQGALNKVSNNANTLIKKLEGMKDIFDDPEDGLLKKIQKFKTDLSEAISIVQTQAQDLINALANPTPETNKGRSLTGYEKNSLISQKYITDLTRSAFIDTKYGEKASLSDDNIDKLKKYISVAEYLGMISKDNSAYKDLFDSNNTIGAKAYKELAVTVGNLRNSMINTIEGFSTDNSEQYEGGGKAKTYIESMGLNLPGITSIEELLNTFKDLLAEY